MAKKGYSDGVKEYVNYVQHGDWTSITLLVRKRKNGDLSSRLSYFIQILAMIKNIAGKE